VAIAYLAGAWLLTEVAGTLFPVFGIPDWGVRFVVIVLALGFLPALIISWAYELTPEGLKREKDVVREASITHFTAKRLDGITIGLIVVALAFLLADRLWLGPRYAGQSAATVEVATDNAQTSGPESTEPRYAPNSIAVLPLRNLSGNVDQDYFVAGMHEALISSLSKVEALKVISRTSVMRYAHSDQSIPEIAEELNVDAVMEGSVNPVGDRVRISVQLIDAQTDVHLWADEYDRDLRDVLVLLSQIAESVVEEVEAVLAPEDAEILRSAESVDPQLNDLYMRGRYSYGSFSRDGLVRAAEYFEQAIEIDPTFAPAWAGISSTHILAAYLGYVPATEGIADAESAALRTLALNNGLALAHTTLGWVRLFQFNWEEARKAFEKALDINPNDPDALHGFGDYLTITGSAEEGMNYVKRARDNDPFSPLWGHAVVAHLHMMRRFEEAISESEKVLELYPTSPVWGIRGNANLQLGRLDEALDCYRKVFERQPDLLDTLEQGKTNDGAAGAIRAIADAAALTARQTQSGAFRVAIWYAMAGDTAETLAWLEQAYTQGSPDLIYVSIRPELDIMYSVPEFRELIDRMGLAVSGEGRNGE
jgi:TolB-like protein